MLMIFHMYRSGWVQNQFPGAVICIALFLSSSAGKFCIVTLSCMLLGCFGIHLVCMQGTGMSSFVKS